MNITSTVSPRVVQHNSPCVPNKTVRLVKSFKTDALVKPNNFEVFPRKLTDFKYEYYICIIDIFLWPQCMWFSVKNLPTKQETRIRSWVRKIPWRRKWQFTPGFIPDPMDRGAWWATVHGVSELDTNEQLNNNGPLKHFFSLNFSIPYNFLVEF